MSNPYIGEIRMFGGNFAPAGWSFCNGQLLPISEYDALFNLIGTTYGGDGQSTFAVPDLQSRLPMHVGAGRILAQTGGAESVTLTQNQLPAHRHALAAAAVATSSTPGGNVWASDGDMPYSTAAPTIPMGATALAPTGGSQPHENMPPFLAVSFIISLFGIYPSPT
ncbi:MAG: phage tail protein [Frankiales bacterium]|nr:phage tail protein [Frankiales bacterium]